jgi:hypothetical protein
LKSENSGKLRIGDNWNAIRIIALSQNNPLKAVAEFVENSIDARAQTHHPGAGAAKMGSISCGLKMTGKGFVATRPGGPISNM